MTTRLEILGDDGKWHEVPGIASVELDQEEFEIPDSVWPPPAVRQRAREVHEAAVRFMRAYVDTVRPQVEEMSRTFATAARALRSAGLIDEDGRVVRQPDRPAWQSPYGPPPRRR